MSRRATGPRYWPSLRAYGVWYQKKRHVLASGDENDNYVRAAAWRRYWELTGATIIDKVQVVDWPELLRHNNVAVPDGSEKWTIAIWQRYWTEARSRTALQVQEALDGSGITEEMMSLFVAPPKPLKDEADP
jgi:hypothetical protein